MSIRCLLWPLIEELVRTHLKLLFQGGNWEETFFPVRVIQRWNSLSEGAVMQHTLYSFKWELDRELSDLLYSML